MIPVAEEGWPLGTIATDPPINLIDLLGLALPRKQLVDTRPGPRTDHAKLVGSSRKPFELLAESCDDLRQSVERNLLPVAPVTSSAGPA
jgi:hypothetical protein